MMFKFPDSEATVETVVGLADRARREGLLSLEDAARNVEDVFLRDGLQAAIDGTKYIVAESMDEVTELVVDYRARVVAATLALATEPEENLDEAAVVAVSALRLAPRTLSAVPEVD